LAQTQGDVTLDQALEAVNSVLAKSRRNAPVATAETTMEELGLTSLDIAEVVVALEDLIGGELDTANAADVNRVGDLVLLRRA
jgi:acyl carrier protein